MRIFHKLVIIAIILLLTNVSFVIGQTAQTALLLAPTDVELPPAESPKIDSSKVEFWLQGTVCTNPNFVFVGGIVASGIDLSEELTAKQILQLGIAFGQEKCTSANAIYVWLWPNREAVKFGLGDDAVSGGWSNKKPGWIVGYQNNPRALKTHEASASALWTAFVRANKVNRWVTIEQLTPNPFIYQGQVVAFYCEFSQMRSLTQGIFKLNNDQIIVSDLPTSRFSQSGNPIILAGRVLGNIEVNFGGSPRLLPHVSYTGSVFCQLMWCYDYGMDLLSGTPVMKSKGSIVPNSDVSLTPTALQKAVVLRENANLRKTPDPQGDVVNKVAKGETVEIVKQNGAWFLVKYGGATGWMHGNTIRLVTKTVRKNALGMELVYIPPGEFMMGSTDAEVDKALFVCNQKYNKTCKREWLTQEQPKHKVTIRDGFWMGKYEVTQGQWEQVMGTTLRQQRDKLGNSYGIYGEGANYPMSYVSWEEAKDFVRRMNEKSDGFEYSLPSESQWEYAARAGTTVDYYGNLDDIAWYANNSGRTSLDADSIVKNEKNDEHNYGKRITENGGQAHLVGTKRPNNFGLYDMTGNVLEWCEDIYNKDGYSGSPIDGSANLSRGDSKYRVIRGGSWFDIAGNSRSANRATNAMSARGNTYGFRIIARLK